MRGLVRRAHGEFVHIGLAEIHRAGGVEALDHLRIVGCGKVGEDFRAAGGAPAFGAKNVFLGDRDAGERPGLALGNPLIRRIRLRQRFLGVDRDEGVERGIELRDAVEKGLR